MITFVILSDLDTFIPISVTIIHFHSLQEEMILAVFTIMEKKVSVFKNVSVAEFWDFKL